MNKHRILILLGIATLLSQRAVGQRNAYLGYVYPAGGQQDTTVPVRIGGQRIDGATGAIVSGEGVTVELGECFRRIGNQEMRILKNQVKLLRKREDLDEETRQVRSKAQRRVDEEQRRPASQSLATLALLNVTIDRKAEPGLREIRLMTPKGLSNPLPFYVGRLPESSRKAMKISKFQTLGKEHLAQRKRPPEEEEKTIQLPCTVNGQVASGEINRYRFEAHKGDRLVIQTLARRLVPYIADAVPGWFQPVISLRNSEGKEVAFNDDYLFKPDPTLLFEVPSTEEYVLSIHDSIYRGREDFVYRMTLGETPFITSVFPAGRRVGEAVAPKIEGWNLDHTKLKLPEADSPRGLHPIVADRRDALSNTVPFMLDTLPERREMEAPDGGVQKVKLPLIVNGRIEKPGDEDVYKFFGKKGQTLVAEIHARRLDSPLDSIIKLTDKDGSLVAFNDDHSDPGSGLNTHHADSYLRLKLPASGQYQLHLTDTARQGGNAYTYRLRLSHPRPDFELRTVPSHLSIKGGGARGKKGKGGGFIDVFAIRKDGFNGPIRLTVRAPGLRAKPATIPAGKEKVRFKVQAVGLPVGEPVSVTVAGTAQIGQKKRVRKAVPSEDWMQAFLWRHLVPAQELLAFRYRSQQKNRPLDLSGMNMDLAELSASKDKAIKQVAGRIRRLGLMYQDGLLTEKFFQETVQEFYDFAQKGEAK